MGQEGVREEGKEMEQEGKEVEEQGKEVKSACVDQLMEQEKGMSRQAGEEEDDVHASVAEECSPAFVAGQKVSGQAEEEDSYAELRPVRKYLNFGSADTRTHELTRLAYPLRCRGY